LKEIKLKLLIWKIESDFKFESFFEFIFDFSTNSGTLLKSVAIDLLEQMKIER